MLAVLKGLNLGVAFLLELAALAAFGYWGAQAGGGTLGKIALAVGAPLLVAVVWGLFLAPKAVLQAPSGAPTQRSLASAHEGGRLRSGRRRALRRGAARVGGGLRAGGGGQPHPGAGMGAVRVRRGNAE
jgi:Protein of unknown function (DUF2568)